MTMLAALIPNFEHEVDRLNAIGSSGFIMGFGLSFTGIEHLYNTYPEEWRRIYEDRNYMVGDPILAWHVANVGHRRWSAVKLPDFRGVMREAAEFGMIYGAVFSEKVEGKKSFMTISRADRELTDEEIEEVRTKFATWVKLVLARAALTSRELEVLRAYRDGLDRKQTAEVLKISESTVKQRTRGACAKLQANSLTQAVAIAVQRHYFDT